MQASKVLSVSSFDVGETQFVVDITATPMTPGLHPLNQTAKAVLPLRPVPSYGLVVTINKTQAWLPNTPGKLPIVPTHCRTE